MNSTALNTHLFICIAMAFLFMSGCGDNSKCTMTGSITLDGNPVKNGNISFYPQGLETTRKVATVVENGKFQIETNEGLIPGKYKAEVHWTKGTGKKIPSADPGIMMEQMIQGKESLEIEVNIGANKQDFKLKSKQIR